jgi:hypothetical protein
MALVHDNASLSVANRTVPRVLYLTVGVLLFLTTTTKVTSSQNSDPKTKGCDGTSGDALLNRPLLVTTQASEVSQLLEPTISIDRGRAGPSGRRHRGVVPGDIPIPIPEETETLSGTIHSAPASAYAIRQSSGARRQLSAQIIQAYTDQRIVRLFLGHKHGVVPGDVFCWKRRRNGEGFNWLFTVTNVDVESAWADMQELIGDTTAPRTFPNLGTTAEWISLDSCIP